MQAAEHGSKGVSWSDCLKWEDPKYRWHLLGAAQIKEENLASCLVALTFCSRFIYPVAATAAFFH